MGLAKNKISEQAVEALTQAKTAQQEMAWLRRQLSRQRSITQALWDLVKGKLTLTDEDLMSAVEKLEQAKSMPRVAELCSQCGRSLQENRSFCIYCGLEVKKRELF